MARWSVARTDGRAAPGRLAILYDGECEACRAMLAMLRDFDNSAMINALDLHDEETRAQFPGLELDRLMDELHAVDDRGRVFRGARAINEILRRQPGLAGLLAWLWYFPGYAWLANWQYRRLAASRYRYAPKRGLDSSSPGE